MSMNQFEKDVSDLKSFLTQAENLYKNRDCATVKDCELFFDVARGLRVSLARVLEDMWAFMPEERP